MRVKVTGDSAQAASIRKGLIAEGFAVTDFYPTHEIIVETTTRYLPEVDGVDCELERQIVSCISRIANTPIILQRAGGQVRRDNEIRIVIPTDECLSAKIEDAIVKGFAMGAVTSTTPSMIRKPKKWYHFFS